eukprot:4979389-Amphidinium_carterae.2
MRKISLRIPDLSVVRICPQSHHSPAGLQGRRYRFTLTPEAAALEPAAPEAGAQWRVVANLEGHTYCSIVGDNKPWSMGGREATRAGREGRKWSPQLSGARRAPGTHSWCALNLLSMSGRRWRERGKPGGAHLRQYRWLQQTLEYGWQEKLREQDAKVASGVHSRCALNLLSMSGRRWSENSPRREVGQDLAAGA